jgi:hypothetical protein
VDPVPDPLLIRKSGSAGNRTRASGSVAIIFKNSVRNSLETLLCYTCHSVNPVPDPLLVRKSGSAGNRTRVSGSVARNSDY